MAHYARRSRRSTVTPLKPIVAFLLLASFGILFAGCSGSSETPPEEVVFTQEELEKARELSGRSPEPAATGSSSMIGTLTMSGSSNAPDVDLSQVALYNSIRSGPSALPGNLYRVTYDFLNIRSEPRVTATTIGKKVRGEFFDVIDFINGSWAKVRLQNGKEGYVSSEYLAKIVTEEKLAEEKKKFEGLYVVDYTFLNVRKQPASGSEKLGELPGQSIVRPLLIEGEWAKLVFQGQEGYVSSEYLTPFLPTFLVRQETFTLPILHYRLSQPDMLETLVRHVAGLKDAGYKPVTLREFYDLLLKQEQRDVRLDPKQVVIAVSDVTPENVKTVTETLNRNAVHATVFLRTKDLGFAGITEKALLSLVAAGQDIQSAGHTGDDLRSLSNPQVDLELKQSRKLIEDVTRKPVFAILHPLGGTNDRVTQMAAQAGYLLGLTNASDRTFQRDRLLQLPSVSVASQTSDDLVKFIRGN